MSVRLDDAVGQDDAVRQEVREHYARVANSDGACGSLPGCCASKDGASLALGYSSNELNAVPPGADMGLGCGTPLAFARPRDGEVVLDLGSGGGLDCFIAGKQVGATGRVIGVDMTPDMVHKARANAARVGAENVEFRLGEIEHLPVADRSVDVVVSNCVLNLSPDKPGVLREAFRVLRPGGRLAISDVLLSAPLPAELRSAPSTGCVSGAATVPEMSDALQRAGFANVEIELRTESRAFIGDWLPGSRAEDYVTSAAIRAVRPSGDACCGTAPGASCC